MSWETTTITLPSSKLQAVHIRSRESTKQHPIVEEVQQGSEAHKVGLREGALLVEINCSSTSYHIDEQGKWQTWDGQDLSLALSDLLEAKAETVSVEREFVFAWSPFMLVCPQLLDLWEHAIPTNSSNPTPILYPNCKETAWAYHSTPACDMPKVDVNDAGTGEFDQYIKRLLNPYITHFVFFPGRASQMFHSTLLDVLPHMYVLAGATRQGVQQACYAIERGAQTIVLGKTSISCDNLVDVLHSGTGKNRSMRWQGHLKSAAMGSEPEEHLHDFLQNQLANLGGQFKRRPNQDEHVGIPGRIAQIVQSLGEADMSHFVVFNALEDSAAEMVERMTRSLSIAITPEMNEIGFYKDERRCLEYAWELYLIYKHNANRHVQYASLLWWVINVIAVGTTFCALFYTALFPMSIGPGEVSITLGSDFDAQQGLMLLTSAFPLFTAFVLSVETHMNPRTKAAFLKLAAFRVRQEIYRYRCRVGQYDAQALRNLKSLFAASRARRSRAPHAEPAVRNSRAIADQDQQLPPGAVAITVQEGEAPVEGPVMQRHSNRREDAPQTSTNSAGAQPRGQAMDAQGNDLNVPRVRECFAQELKDIQEDLMRSDVQSSALEKPPRGMFEKLQKSDRLDEEALFNERTLLKFVQKDKVRMGKHLTGADNIKCEKVEIEKWMDAHRVTAHSDFSMLSAVVRDYELTFDEGILMMTGDDYFKSRLVMQLLALNQKIPHISSLLRSLHILLALLTGASALLALLRYTHWVPLCVAFASSIKSYIDFHRLPDTLLECNQAVSQLRSLRIWWQSLSTVQSRLPQNENQLVTLTEGALAITATWVKSLDRVKSLSEAAGGQSQESNSNTGTKGQGTPS